MNTKLFSIFLFLACSLTITINGQNNVLEADIESQTTLLGDSISQDTPPLSLAEIQETTVVDSLFENSIPVSQIDTTKKINYWRITERTGKIIAGKPDTILTDYVNRTNVEGHSVAVAYLGNLGLPMESRVFFERKDRSNFMFNDPYYAYTKSLDNFNFINTKVPHSNISYQTAGSRENKEERFQALVAVSYGKKLSIGVDVDYLYARGFYNSQNAKHLEWAFFGNYIDDRHQLHFLFNPADHTNAENGGITDDKFITHQDEIDDRNLRSKELPTNFTDTWNHLKGNSAYLNYHYNLGFEKNTNTVSEEGDTIKQFIPVSSIIYTFDYKDKNRKFYTQDSLGVSKFYNDRDFLINNSPVRDSTSYWSLSNTVALSMREGFSSWAKFDLTAFLTQDFRSYTMMDTISMNKEENQKSTYIGGELAKRTGNILRYDAKGSLGVLGDNLGDMNLSGHIETRIPVWKDTASINLNGHIKNLAPTYYENNYQSRYFWWKEDFDKVKRVFVGGDIDIPHTKTNLRLGVENVTDYIYFDKTGYPKQHAGSIQVIAAQVNQDFRFRAFHWDNQLVYQKSNDESIIPLPDLSLYSSMYVQFAVAKVLTIQMGANAHYWTKYYSPTYEPATQQFRLQDEIKVGNYPLISGFLNCHLKQTRFFIEYYNAGAAFISPPEYFSIPHYPVNPTVLKVGVSIDFIN